MKQIMIICLWAWVAATACVPPHSVPTPERRPLGKNFEVFEASESSIGQPIREIKAPEGELALSQALALALLGNFKLASASWDVRVSEAQALQAGLLPNPELEFEAEEVAGSDSGSVFGDSEMTIGLGQVLELGGKRTARVQLAGIESRLAGWDYEAERLGVLTATTLAFLDVLVAQEQLLLIHDTAQLAEETLKTVVERVNAGKVSPLEQTKASVEVAGAKVELQKAQGDLRTARLRLAATWGGGLEPVFKRAVGDLSHIALFPEFAVVREHLEANPAVARLAQETERRLAALALERARRIPDLTVGVGVQRFEATDDHALTFGLGMPLPVFDRNQGGVREAQYRLEQMRLHERDTRVQMTATLAEAFEILTVTRAEALALREEVLPAATEAFEATQEGYRQGRSGYMEVLDAQRTFAETRNQLLNALARLHRSKTIVEGLIGCDLVSLQQTQIKTENGS